MRFGTFALSSAFVFATAFGAQLRLNAQQGAPVAEETSPVQISLIQAIPEAPTPQIALAQTADPQSQQQTSAPAQPSQQSRTPASDQPSSGSQSSSISSSSSSNSQQPSVQQTDRQKAAEQLKQQETQRVAGVMATFNTTRDPNALPLSSGQKFQLFFKSAFDPWPFGLSAVVAGIGQAEDSTPEWGGGTEGYAKRFGAGYADYFLGNLFGNAILPSVLHEDPRYFQKGSGKAINRVLWAAASTVWCKRDNGKWGPNWSNVGGNLIGSAIGRVYYPAADRTVSGTISDGLTVSAEGIVGAEVIEWWPDLARHHQRKKAEKAARAAGTATGQNQEARPEAKPDDQSHN
jgi:hypothetical protein